MTKILAVTAVLTAMTFAGFSQNRFIQNAHVGVLYPISSNGNAAMEYTNRFSLHIFSGVSKNERGLIVSGLASVIKDSAAGLQVAGISNRVGKIAQGLQMAGIINECGDMTGLQVGGIINRVRGDCRGAQVAGLVNLASGNAEGGQIGGLVNAARDTRIQLAGLVNRSAKAECQVGGLVNTASVAGLQVAGLVNKAPDANAQIAGLVNQASEAAIQVAGLVNIAGKVRGLQLAGLVNIADSSDYPVGIINLIKNGEKGISLTTDEVLTTLLSFRSGGRILYGMIGAGYNFRTGRHLYALEAGLGAHIPIAGSFRLNGEAAFQTLSDLHRGEYFNSTLRILAAWKPAKGLELFAGPSFNHVQYTNEKGNGLREHYTWNKTVRGRFYGLAPGAVAGIQVSW